MHNGERVIPSAHLSGQKLKLPEPSTPHSQKSQEAEPVAYAQPDGPSSKVLSLKQILQGEKEELVV